MQRLVWCICLFCMCGMARGQTDYEYIYWFDGDDSSIKTIEASGNQLHLDTDVSHLNGELHTLTMQVRDEEGVLSPPETRMFMLFNDVSALQGYYWFDNEDNSSVELYGRGSFDVDVSALEDGLHTIHYMTVDVNGNHSSPKTRWFAKIPQTANEGTVLCRCVIDGEPYHIEEVSAMGGIINWSFDVSKLPETLKTMFDHPIWDEYAFKCLNCGTCSYICPTCHCFDINNKMRGTTGLKLRTWDSCMFGEYTLMAGGHQPRPGKKERVRNRFLHKLQYFNEKHDMSLCVGCGRCIAKCPVNMDITKFIRQVIAE